MNRKRAWQWVDIAVVAGVWGLVTLSLSRAVPVYDQVFREFGAVLPVPTIWVLRASRFMTSWWIPVVCLGTAVLGFFQLHRTRRSNVEPEPLWERVTVGILIALGVLVLLFIWSALYLPTFPDDGA